jgi:hypothetical protein
MTKSKRSLSGLLSPQYLHIDDTKNISSEIAMNISAEAKDLSEQQPLYEKYVNPQWVSLLDVLGMNVQLWARRVINVI